MITEEITQLIHTIQNSLPMVAIAAFFGFIKTLFMKEARNITSYMVAIFVSVLVGYLVGNFLLELGWKPNAVNLAVAVSALLSNQIVSGLLYLGEQFKTNPIQFAKDIKELKNPVDKKD